MKGPEAHTQELQERVLDFPATRNRGYTVMIGNRPALFVFNCGEQVFAKKNGAVQAIDLTYRWFNDQATLVKVFEDWTLTSRDTDASQVQVLDSMIPQEDLAEARALLKRETARSEIDETREEVAALFYVTLGASLFWGVKAAYEYGPEFAEGFLRKLIAQLPHMPY